MSSSARSAAARRGARTRAARGAAGWYAGRPRRSAAEKAADQAEAGLATLDDVLGPSRRTFSKIDDTRASRKVPPWHADAAGRRYRQAQRDEYFFQLPPGGQPPEPDEVLQLTSPEGKAWSACVTFVQMDLERRRTTGRVFLDELSVAG